jgi:hypothetical protein
VPRTPYVPGVQGVGVADGALVWLLGYTNNELTAEQRGAALTPVAGQAARGALAVDHEVVPLAEVAAAWTRQATGAASGRIVLTP